MSQCNKTQLIKPHLQYIGILFNAFANVCCVCMLFFVQKVLLMLQLPIRFISDEEMLGNAHTYTLNIIYIIYKILYSWSISTSSTLLTMEHVDILPHASGAPVIPFKYCFCIVKWLRLAYHSSSWVDFKYM